MGDGLFAPKWLCNPIPFKIVNQLQVMLDPGHQAAQARDDRDGMGALERQAFDIADPVRVVVVYVDNPKTIIALGDQVHAPVFERGYFRNAGRAADLNWLG